MVLAQVARPSNRTREVTIAAAVAKERSTRLPAKSERYSKRSRNVETSLRRSAALSAAHLRPLATLAIRDSNNTDYSSSHQADGGYSSRLQASLRLSHAPRAGRVAGLQGLCALASDRDTLGRYRPDLRTEPSERLAEQQNWKSYDARRSSSPLPTDAETLHRLSRHEGCRGLSLPYSERRSHATFLRNRQHDPASDVHTHAVCDDSCHSLPRLAACPYLVASVSLHVPPYTGIQTAVANGMAEIQDLGKRRDGSGPGDTGRFESSESIRSGRSEKRTVGPSLQREPFSPTKGLR